MHEVFSQINEIPDTKHARKLWGHYSIVLMITPHVIFAVSFCFSGFPVVKPLGLHNPRARGDPLPDL